MDRPQRQTIILMAALLLVSSLAGCAYHNMGGGNACAAPGAYPSGSGGAGYPQGGPAPYGQAPARNPGLFGSGGY